MNDERLYHFNDAEIYIIMAFLGHAAAVLIVKNIIYR